MVGVLNAVVAVYLIGLPLDYGTTVEHIAARALLIHDWGRIVLHDPGLPAALLPAGWPGDSARAIARAIYAKLAQPSERWLDEAGLPPLVDPQKFANRFGMATPVA